MDKCRICLSNNKKTLMNIFQYGEINIKYSDMITSIANVKIDRNYGITDQICRGCRKNLSEAYNFKLLIERSDLALNEKSNVKKLKFNSIKDVKLEIELDIKPFNQDNIGQYFNPGVNELLYKNTVIKKIEDNCVGKEPIPVADFLNSIKTENLENNINYDNKSDSDMYAEYMDDYEDFLPNVNDTNIKCPKTKKKSKQKDEDYRPEKKRLIKKKKNEGFTRFLKPGTHVCIKPVYLNEYRLYVPRPDVKKKYVYYRQKPRQMCPHCGKMVSDVKTHILSRHTDTRNYRCDLCNKGYINKPLLEKHIKIFHKRQKDFKCDQCIAAFSSRGDLEKHKLRHTDDRQYTCDVCSKRFKMKTALKRHQMIHNSANKLFNCELCNMSFYNKTQLCHHMRVHTGERPYNCEICTQPYSYKHDFNRHCLKKHGVFLKRRNVRVMNEEVLARERQLIRDVVLKINGLLEDDKSLEVFEGANGAQAFELIVKALQARQIPINFPI